MKRFGRPRRSFSGIGDCVVAFSGLDWKSEKCKLDGVVDLFTLSSTVPFVTRRETSVSWSRHSACRSSVGSRPRGPHTSSTAGHRRAELVPRSPVRWIVECKQWYFYHDQSIYQCVEIVMQLWPTLVGPMLEGYEFTTYCSSPKLLYHYNLPLDQRRSELVTVTYCVQLIFQRWFGRRGNWYPPNTFGHGGTAEKRRSNPKPLVDSKTYPNPSLLRK